MVAKTKTLAELSAMVGGELTGAAEITIHALADLNLAREGEIAFLVKGGDAGLDKLRNSHASAFIVPQSLTYDDQGKKSLPGSCPHP